MNLASALAISLLAAFLLSCFVIGALEHEGLDVLLYTGAGAVMFAVMAAGQVRSLIHDARLRRAQSEYNFTASRHISKPVRSP